MRQLSVTEELLAGTEVEIFEEKVKSWKQFVQQFQEVDFYICNIKAVKSLQNKCCVGLYLTLTQPLQ